MVFATNEAREDSVGHRVTDTKHPCDMSVKTILLLILYF